jgi:hypothetical protein
MKCLSRFLLRLGVSKEDDLDVEIRQMHYLNNDYVVPALTCHGEQSTKTAVTRWSSSARRKRIVISPRQFIHSCLDY